MDRSKAIMEIPYTYISSCDCLAVSCSLAIAWFVDNTLNLRESLACDAFS